MNFKDRLENELNNNEFFSACMIFCISVLIVLIFALLLISSPYSLLLLPSIPFLYVMYKILLLLFRK